VMSVQSTTRSVPLKNPSPTVVGVHSNVSSSLGGFRTAAFAPSAVSGAGGLVQFFENKVSSSFKGNLAECLQEITTRGVAIISGSIKSNIKLNDFVKFKRGFVQWIGKVLNITDVRKTERGGKRTVKAVKLVRQYHIQKIDHILRDRLRKKNSVPQLTIAIKDEIKMLSDQELQSKDVLRAKNIFEVGNMKNKITQWDEKLRDEDNTDKPPQWGMVRTRH
jgi:hypothetical protein